MILAPARVQDACARIDIGNVSLSFHRVSEPVLGGLPYYAIDLPAGRRGPPPKPMTFWSAHHVAAALAMADEGQSVRQIGKKVGRSSHAVQKKLRRARPAA